MHKTDKGLKMLFLLLSVEEIKQNSQNTNTKYKYEIRKVRNKAKQKKFEQEKRKRKDIAAVTQITQSVDK